jgi:hypothetical protein
MEAKGEYLYLLLKPDMLTTPKAVNDVKTGHVAVFPQPKDRAVTKRVRHKVGLTNGIQYVFVGPFKDP